MKVFLQSLFIVLIGLQGICVGSPTDPINLGFRRELFIDRFLIAEMTGVELRLHEPKLAPATSGPADNLEYGTVIKDGMCFVSTLATGAARSLTATALKSPATAKAEMASTGLARTWRRHSLAGSCSKGKA